MGSDWGRRNDEAQGRWIHIHKFSINFQLTHTNTHMSLQHYFLHPARLEYKTSLNISSSSTYKSLFHITPLTVVCCSLAWIFSFQFLHLILLMIHPYLFIFCAKKFSSPLKWKWKSKKEKKNRKKKEKNPTKKVYL